MWFQEWLPNRADKRGRKVVTTAAAARAQLAKLGPYGPAEAVEKVRTAIANQWQGVVFAGDAPATPPPAPAAGRTTAERLANIDQPAGPMAGLRPAAARAGGTDGS